MKKVPLLALVSLIFTATGYSQNQSLEPSGRSPLDICFTPHISIPSPLYTYSSLFAIGGGTELSCEYTLPFLTQVTVDAGIGFELNRLAIKENIFILTGSLGLGFNLPFTDQIGLRISAGGGYFHCLPSPGYFYLYPNGRRPVYGSGNAVFDIDAGVDIGLSPAFDLRLGVAYAYYLGFNQTANGFLGITYNVPQDAPKTTQAKTGPLISTPVKAALAISSPAIAAPDKETVTAARSVPSTKHSLEITGSAFESIFPIFHTYYDDHPIGQITVKNTSPSAATEIKISLIIRQFMDTAKECGTILSLAPGASATMDLFALMKNNILDVTQATKTAAEIIINYHHDDADKTITKSETIRVFDRNAMTWDDNRKAAAFVAAKDPIVLSLSNSVAFMLKGGFNRAVDKNLQMAMAIHEALLTYGISYISNPLTPYAVVSQDKLAVDTLKFPRQTLNYRAGDCSDLSILYCTLLESVQIETAFITIPGHIFMAFALKVTPNEARTSFLRPDEFIFYDEKTWVPIEVTERNQNFLSAWQEGIQEWRQSSIKNQAGFYPIHEAWKTYEPVGFVNTPGQEILLDSVAVRKRFSETINQFVNRETFNKVAELQARITESKERPDLINQLGILYARYDLLDKAEKEFTRILEKEEYLPALINIGNLFFLRKEYEKALEYYSRAFKLDAESSVVVLCMARTCFELEDYYTVKRTYAKLKTISPDLSSKYAYLDFKGEEGFRAAEIGGTRETVIWEEAE